MASNAEAASKRPAWGRWSLGVGLVLAVVAFYSLRLDRLFTWEFVRSHLDQIQIWVEENFLPALVSCLLIYVAVTALSLPVATILSLAVGAIFGRWVGTGLVAVSATLGATLAFLSSRYLFREWVQRRLGARLEALNRGFEKDGPFYLFTLRLVPLFPFFLINLGMGLTRMRVRTFAWVSLVGMLPGTFLYVNAGSALGSLESPAEVASPGILISFALLGIVPLVLRKWLFSGSPPFVSSSGTRG
jgi:uncharacterized membrane protein YdjX (TVP38/TMEM64 family)